MSPPLAVVLARAPPAPAGRAGGGKGRLERNRQKGRRPVRGARARGAGHDEAPGRGGRGQAQGEVHREPRAHPRPARRASTGRTAARRPPIGGGATRSSVVSASHSSGARRRRPGPGRRRQVTRASAWRTTTAAAVSPSGSNARSRWSGPAPPRPGARRVDVGDQDAHRPPPRRGPAAAPSARRPAGPTLRRPALRARSSASQAGAAGVRAARHPGGPARTRGQRWGPPAPGVRARAPPRPPRPPGRAGTAGGRLTAVALGGSRRGVASARPI